MKCPNCNISLVMTERNAVEIDYCPDCRGVWLDRGELDKIIERAATVPSHNGVKADSAHSKGLSLDGDYGYRKKKRDGFFGDLFDF